MEEKAIKGLNNLGLLDFVYARLDLEAKKTIQAMYELHNDVVSSTAIYNNCAGIKAAMSVVKDIQNLLLKEMYLQ